MKCNRLALMIVLFGGLYWNAYGLMTQGGSNPLQAKDVGFTQNNLKGESNTMQSMQARMAGLEQQVASLLTQLNQVKADFRKDSDLLAQTLASVNREVDRQDLDNDREFDDPMTAVQQAELQEEQRQASIESRFQNETIDVAWAQDSSNAIDDVLDNEALKNTDVIEHSCRTTLCRLEVQHQDQRDLAGFEVFLPLQVGERFTELSMQHKTGSDGEVSTVIYLAREDFHLPDVELSE